MTLGDYIKKYRTVNKLSQDDFALRSGMSKAYISILERNCNPTTGKAAIPSLETIRRVACATYVDFNSLLAMLDRDQQVTLVRHSAEDKGPSAARGERDILDEVDIAFYGDYRELTEDDKATVRDMVKLMRHRRSRQTED